jgi:hypothetical protein
MKVKEMDDFISAFEVANESEMINSFMNEFGGCSKKDEDTLKGFISKLVTKVCNKKFPFASLEDVNSIILPECINQIKIMKDSTKTKDTLKNEPDRIKGLLTSAANRRVIINKVCLNNYILPEFASAVIVACLMDVMTSATYAAVKESGIAEIGATKEQLEEVIRIIVPIINEGINEIIDNLNTIIQNNGKYSN